MSSVEFKRYRVVLSVGRKGVEVEVIVSSWNENHIEETINYLYDDKATAIYYEEITHVEDK